MRKLFLGKNVSLHRAIQGSRVILIVILGIVLPCAAAKAQQPDSTGKASTSFPITSLSVVQMTGYPQKPAVLPAETDRRHSSSVRPIIIGAVIGGALGAFIGHETVGAPSSCATSPNYACDHNGFGTFGFALSGAFLGGLAGLVISRWH